MSPRAAWRLERMGFGPVYDYVGGKADWIGAGLATVRADRSERRALDVADRDPPTCAPDDVVDDLPPGAVIVVNEQGVVLGGVPADRPPASGRAAEEIMEPGPATVRAHEPLEPLLERMASRDVDVIIVTTPEGRLLGVVRRD